MAAKKKAKSKKAKSTLKSKKPALKKTKKVKKKAGKKKSVVRKVKPTKAAAKKKPAMRPKPAPKPAPMTPVAMPGEERIGIVTHYYNHLGVAIVQLETGVLRSGDTVHIKGHTSDFRQMVGSMEVNHVHVDTAQSGSSFGLRVNDPAREHDVVYKVKNT